MKGCNYWSYAPYTPLVSEKNIYICRVVPYENKIHFEWLSDEKSFKIFCRKKGNEEFILFGTTENNEYDILNLDCDTDYEFYVESETLKSKIRLARCGKSIGSVVNYLHPEDDYYANSGHFLCSPSLVRHPDGFLLASMDIYEADQPQNLTLIFRSDDEGESWHYVSELFPCFWGSMFIHKNELYMLSCNTEYGDLIIGKSTDGGKTFSAPVTILRGLNGKGGKEGMHRNPQNIFHYNGRIYTSVEWGNWENTVYSHAAMVMSCDENDDLSVPENWSFTEPKVFNPDDAPELNGLPKCTMTIEGTIVLSPEDKLLNIMRFGRRGYALCYEIDKTNHEEMLKYSYSMEFNAHNSKFMIKKDEKTGYYYTIANYIYDEEKLRARNLLCLMKSKDLKKWEIVSRLFDYSKEDHEKIGFQYVVFYIENDDIIYLCRTAMNNANTFHDSNYITFHKIENFREL